MALSQKAILSLSRISHVVFLSFKQNVVPLYCSFKSVVRTPCITVSTHNSKQPWETA